MMNFKSILLLAVLFAPVDARRIVSKSRVSSSSATTGQSAPAQAEPVKLDPSQQFWEFFALKGYQPFQIARIMMRFSQDKVNMNVWPFQNFAKEWTDSANSKENPHCTEVAKLIDDSGGNHSDPDSVTSDVEDQVSTTLQEAEQDSRQLLSARNDGGSLLETTSSGCWFFCAKRTVQVHRVTSDAGAISENTAAINKVGDTLAKNLKTQNAAFESLGKGISTNANNAAGNANNIANQASNIGQNSQNIATNANNINNIGSQAATNANNIAGNANNIAGNANNIATNANNVAGNANTILTNAENVAGNANNIATNANNIQNIGSQAATNANDIAGNANAMAGNANNIATNANNAAGNANTILTNAENVNANANNILANAENLNGVANTAANNANNIAGNAANINDMGNQAASNANAIGNNANVINDVSQQAASNANQIAGNANNINNIGSQAATNANNIADNANSLNNIGGQAASNANNIANNAAGMADNAGNIATNANNVANNANNIATNANNAAGNANNIMTNANNVAGNANNIASNANNVANNANTINSVANTASSNSASMASNANNIATNANNVAGNANNIASNANNVATNANNIAGNANNIAANSNNVLTNANNIAGNSNTVATNANNIATMGNQVAGNSADIAANAANAGTNANNIATNAANIATTNTNVAGNAANIAGNSANAANNAANIGQNAANIAGNSATLGANTANIGQNAATIAANSGNIATNANNVAALGNFAATNTANIGANAANIANIGSQVGSNAANIASNTANIGVLGSDIAANTASIGRLSSSVATNAAGIVANAQDIAKMGLAVSVNQGLISGNAAAIATLTTQVAQMSQVTGPTIALATALNVPIGTVSSLALAGSFVGPLLGVLALAYAAWPRDEVDPWLKVEGRVAKMFSDKFDEKRRKKLSNRLKRYVKEFSRCAQAWVATSMVKENGISVPRWIVEEAALSAQTGNFDMNANMKKDHPAPACMAQLEGHMSLERDEWFTTDKGKLSALFMPFANMHTQMLNLLADHPYDDQMQWGKQLKTSAAEYGGYMLDHLLGAWQAQMCRTMRLRTSMKNGYWKYQFIVFTQVNQPNAAEECSSHCDGKSDWCNWCGGKNVGACCKRGDGGVCRMFDTPVGWHGSTYGACVHTDCIQSNTGYYGKRLQKFQAIRDNDGNKYDAEQCQSLCLNVAVDETTGNVTKRVHAVAFTLTEEGVKCNCLAQEGLSRHQEVGAFSGPVRCGAPFASLQQEDEALAASLESAHKVPVHEVEPCEKSPAESNFAEIEEKHPQWVNNCYKNATKIVVDEFNTFHKKFAEFIARLAWASGCGARTDDIVGDGWSSLSSTSSGNWASCDWSREAPVDTRWQIDDMDRSRGWTGTSAIRVDEQAAAKIQYPMPLWLDTVSRFHQCFKNTAKGSKANRGGGRRTAVTEITESVASDDTADANSFPGATPEERTTALLSIVEEHRQ